MTTFLPAFRAVHTRSLAFAAALPFAAAIPPVSYTHLTLPTTPYV